MKKILSLSTKNWFSGIAQSYHSNSGIWASATGINPFVDNRIAGSRLGLLQANPAVTDKTGGVVINTPIGWIGSLAANTDQLVYFNGTGTLYSYNVSGESGLTALRTVANLANGIAELKPVGGTRRLFYFQKTQIGMYADLDSSPTFDDDWSVTLSTDTTALQETVHHPTHKFNDVVYYGNKDRIGSLRDDGATGITHSTNDLDFESTLFCTTLSDDGFYLVIGLSRREGTGGTSVFNGTKIRFWDGNSSSWEKEYDLPAPDIISIKKVGVRMYALTSNGLYVFNYSTPPTKVLSLSITDVVTTSATTGGHYSMDVLEDGVVWGASSKLHYYGKMTNNAPYAYHQICYVPSGTATIVSSSLKNSFIYVGTDTPKFGYYNNTSAGTPATSISAESVWIDLENKYKIERIDVVFGTKLESGDTLNFVVGNSPDAINVDFGGTNTISYTNFGAVMSAKLYHKGFDAELLLIKPTFVAGKIKIKRIDIWGTPILD